MYFFETKSLSLHLQFGLLPADPLQFSGISFSAGDRRFSSPVTKWSLAVKFDPLALKWALHRPDCLHLQKAIRLLLHLKRKTLILVVFECRNFLSLVIFFRHLEYRKKLGTNLRVVGRVKEAETGG